MIPESLNLFFLPKGLFSFAFGEFFLVPFFRRKEPKELGLTLGALYRAHGLAFCSFLSQKGTERT